MIKPLRVKDVLLGEGIPKICVPLVGKTKYDLLAEVMKLKTLDFDLVEWRVDHFEDVNNNEKVLEVAKEFKERLKNVPLLFTFRSKEEGGVREFTKDEYFNLINFMIESKAIDLVDVELFMPQDKIKQTVSLANLNDVKVVMCNHDFNKTPSKEEIVNRLKMMQKLDADICKIAVMPQIPNDVLTLLDATNEMYTKHADRPIVTMSMGGLGMISRMSGEAFGSAMTFGSATNASAPGQVPVDELRKILNLINKSL